MIAEAGGPAIQRYPRDESLDPQLVWKGKDAQDGEDLAVPVVPIYIQESISPKALIEDLRATSASRHEAQLDLFSDFDGMPLEERVEFYQHELRWTNRMILGNSLHVMTSLAEKEGLKGKVQMIYVDPPYGIKFGSNWQSSTRKRDVRDGRMEDATRQPEQVRAFRDTWELGIHSYLAYLRDRFAVARDLLTDSGSIFVQISDENVHLVRSVLDEVFGPENFCAQIAFQKTGGFESRLLQRNFDLILWFAKSIPDVKYRPQFVARGTEEADPAFFDFVEEQDGRRRPLSQDERRDLSKLPMGAELFARNPLNSDGYAASLQAPFEFGGDVFVPPPNRHWTTTADGLNRLRAARRLIKKGATLRFVRYWNDYPAAARGVVWSDTGQGGFVGDDKLYVVQTDVRVPQRCMLMATDPGDLVLDPTCGSGTTAYVAEQWGRRWITVDTSRVALALARTRIMSARYPYYLMADTPEGQRREAQVSGQAVTGPTGSDIRKGFVYERVPHVTLKSIAQNPDIHEGMSRDEVDAAIARHAETETLFDRPYQDTKVVRVAGPFTVESLSPHRVVADGPEDRVEPTPAVPIEESGRFVVMVIDNLRKAGVQARDREERLTFTSLDPFPGRWIQAKGEYLVDDQPKVAAVAIGPEFGTVGQELVRAAAKEARGYFDLLVICGFAFDPLVEEEGGRASRMGNLTILQARMNPDLLMGDVLKKTGTGNLFTVFGQPDIDVRSVGEDEIEVEIRGVDIFDPNTGDVRIGTRGHRLLVYRHGLQH